MTLVHFPARKPQRDPSALSARAQAEVERVQRWRGRTIELLARLDADTAHMAMIRRLADELIAGIAQDDAHEDD